MSGVVYRLSGRALSGHIYLKPESWRILAQVNGESSLMEIAQTAGLDEMVVIQIIDSLCQVGVLEAVNGHAPSRTRRRRIPRQVSLQL